MSNERACANTAVFSRRSTLSGMAISCVAAPSSALNQVDEESTILTLFRQYQASRDWIEEMAKEHDDDFLDPLCEELCQLELKLMALPPKSAADFAAKVIVECSNFVTQEQWETDGLWKEARRLVSY